MRGNLLIALSMALLLGAGVVYRHSNRAAVGKAALAQEGVPSAVAFPKGLVPPPVAAMTPGTLPERVDSYVGRSKEELRRLIPTLEDLEELRAAVFALARHLDPSEEDLALYRETLARTTDDELLQTLVWALGPACRTLSLEGWLRSDPAPSVRRAALRLLPTPDNGLILQVAHADADPTVRIEAIQALDQRSAFEREYIAAVRAGRDPEVRAAWILVLAGIGTPTSRATLEEIANSTTETEGIRTMASEVLAATAQKRGLP